MRENGFRFRVSVRSRLPIEPHQLCFLLANNVTRRRPISHHSRDLCEFRPNLRCTATCPFLKKSNRLDPRLQASSVLFSIALRCSENYHCVRSQHFKHPIIHSIKIRHLPTANRMTLLSHLPAVLTQGRENIREFPIQNEIDDRSYRRADNPSHGARDFH